MKSKIEAVNAERLLGPEAAAELLGVSPKTLAIWRSAGRYNLQFVKVGRLVRYRVSDIEAFLRSRTHSA